MNNVSISSKANIGKNANIREFSVIEDDVVIGAGSLVPPGKRLVSGFLYMGSPVKQIRPLKESEKTEVGYTSSDDLTLLVGQTGVVLTLLRPAGTVGIAEKVYDVVSEGRFIQPGSKVRVLSVNGNRIVVRAIED